MLKYKLTSSDHTTHNNTKWGENVTHETNGKGDLCGPGWLHYYHTPELAVLLNPIHADITDPVLWECEAEGEHKDDKGLKGGCTKLTTLRRIPLPECSVKQRVKFGIRCALVVVGEDLPAWKSWAEAYLAGDSVSANARARYLTVLPMLNPRPAFAAAYADAATADAVAAAAYAAVAAAAAARVARAAAYAAAARAARAAAYAAAARAAVDAAAADGLNFDIVQIARNTFKESVRCSG